jgi:hypothetical protein
MAHYTVPAKYLMPAPRSDGVIRLGRCHCGTPASELDITNKTYVDMLAPGYIMPHQFGAVGDGLTDDSEPIQLAANAAVAQNKILFASGGTYLLNSTVDLRFCPMELSAATFIVNNSDDAPGILMGGNAWNGPNKFQHMGMVKKKDWPLVSNHPRGTHTAPYIRLSGVKWMTIKIVFCAYVQVWADATGPTSDTHYRQYYSSAYSQYELYLGAQRVGLSEYDIPTLELYGVSGGWINENSFKLLACTKLIIDSDGSYSHNHNKFIDGCFEGTVAVVNFNVGYSNYLLGARFEGTPTISFGSGVMNCAILCTFNWTPGYSVHVGETVPSTVTDLGTGNTVFNMQELTTIERAIFSLGPTTPFVSTVNKGVTGYTTLKNMTDVDSVRNLVHHLDGTFSTISPFTFMWYPTASELIPINVGDVFYMISDIAMWRLYVYLYDASRKRVQNQSTPSITTSQPMTWDAVNYNWHDGGDRLTSQVRITNTTDAKYIVFNIFAGSSATNSAFSSLLLTSRVARKGNCPRSTVYEPPSRRLKTLRYIDDTDIDMRQVGQGIQCIRNDDGASKLNLYRLDSECVSVVYNGSTATTITLAQAMPYNNNIVGQEIPYY